MAELTLYHAAPSRSSIVRWMLEELGEPYDLHLLSLTKGEQLAPDYLAINPMGKVPAFAMATRSSPRRPPSAPILPMSSRKPGSTFPSAMPRRGPYLKWLFFAPGCIEPAMIDRAYPRQEQPRRGTLGYGDFDTVMDVTAKAVEPGPYLMGEQFTAADVVRGRHAALGFDVQAPARAPRVRRLCRTPRSSDRRCSAPPPWTRSSWQPPRSSGRAPQNAHTRSAVPKPQAPFTARPMRKRGHRACIGSPFSGGTTKKATGVSATAPTTIQAAQ